MGKVAGGRGEKPVSLVSGHWPVRAERIEEGVRLLDCLPLLGICCFPLIVCFYYPTWYRNFEFSRLSAKPIIFWFGTPIAALGIGNRKQANEN